MFQHTNLLLLSVKNLIFFIIDTQFKTLIILHYGTVPTYINKKMEFPNLDIHCSEEHCKQLDFLPIQCQFCSLFYCKTHSLPHHHNCPKVCESNSEINMDIKEKSKEYRYACSLKNCKQWELTPVTCKFCHSMLCLKHKHQLDHNCSEYVAPQNPMAEAAAKIEVLAAQLRSERPKTVKSKKNEKLAAKVQLMKLKGKAIGAMQLPSEERLYFLVHSPKSYAPKEPIAVFVSHHWSVGRVIDAVADLAKVKNRNNEAKVDLLRLFKDSDSSLLHPLDASIKNLLEQEIIFNGDSLRLEYVSKEEVS